METRFPRSVPRDWPQAFARASLGDFELTPALDAELSARALQARGDSDARDALFLELAGKTTRFAGRFERWNLQPFEHDDVLQESYLAFLDTLRGWRPIDHATPTGFGAWFLSVYPRRLARRVARLAGRRLAMLPFLPEADIRPDPDASEAGVIDAMVWDALLTQLRPRDRAIARLRARGVPAAEIATATGISRRGVHRRLAVIAAIGRATVEERAAG